MSVFPNVPVFVFDIETIADLDGARRIYPELKNLNDADTKAALVSLREQEAGHDFMRLPLQRIVCISGLYIHEADNKFSLFSLTAETLSEKDILAKFFRAFNAVNSLPQLVSWNGSGFDIPVLIYRAMQYDLSVPLLFEEGNQVNTMRYNNYVNRFQTRHLDLMDRFSQYGASHREAMDVVASLYDLPGKRDMDGSMVGELVAAADWPALALYCESDVLNTWLIYLRWLRLTGNITSGDFDNWQNQTRAYLTTKVSTNAAGETTACHAAFLSHWT